MLRTWCKHRELHRAVRNIGRGDQVLILNFELFLKNTNFNVLELETILQRVFC